MQCVSFSPYVICFVNNSQGSNPKPKEELKDEIQNEIQNYKQDEWSCEFCKKVNNMPKYECSSNLNKS